MNFFFQILFVDPPKMLSLQKAIVSLTRPFLMPSIASQELAPVRHYVRDFWVENNGYKAVYGHRIAPPKMNGHRLHKRSVRMK